MHLLGVGGCLGASVGREQGGRVGIEEMVESFSCKGCQAKVPMLLFIHTVHSFDGLMD